jgi:prepilin-type N-terminal cleavage/methylation domain-containing protein
MIEVGRRMRRGFSLVELFFAIAILSLGFLSVLGMFTSSFSLVNHSRNLLTATNIASSYLEKIKFRDREMRLVGVSADCAFWAGVDS